MKWFCPKLHHLISRFEGYFSSWHRTCSLKVCGDSVSAEMGWLKFPSFLPCLSLIRVSHRHFVGKSEEGSEAAAILFFTLGCHTALCSSRLLPQMVTYWACNHAAFPALMSSTSLVSPMFSPLMKLLLQATCFVKVRKSESRRESSQFQWVQLLLMSSGLSLLFSTLCPYFLPFRLQASASQVKTTALIASTTA